MRIKLGPLDVSVSEATLWSVALPAAGFLALSAFIGGLPATSSPAYETGAAAAARRQRPCATRTRRHAAPPSPPNTPPAGPLVIAIATSALALGAALSAGAVAAALFLPLLALAGLSVLTFGGLTFGTFAAVGLGVVVPKLVAMVGGAGGWSSQRGAGGVPWHEPRLLLRLCRPHVCPPPPPSSPTPPHLLAPQAVAAGGVLLGWAAVSYLSSQSAALPGGWVGGWVCGLFMQRPPAPACAGSGPCASTPPHPAQAWHTARGASAPLCPLPPVPRRRGRRGCWRHVQWG
jgi:hypothetical protein